jgi:3-hydroxyacyl-CoA dehydrogenase
MSNSSLSVRKAAVLGAGVMGAQIAAHLANADVPVILFDLPAKDGPPNGLVQKAVDGLTKLEPAPLALRDRSAWIDAVNYGNDLPRLAECDLIIEAIAERIDWKRDLYAKIAPHIAPHAVVASNTSGLSLAALSDALPEALRHRFCGVHFFNPPRYMHLVELIPAPGTEAPLLDALEAFLTTTPSARVIRAKTPNFIANRIGIFLLATMAHTAKSDLADVATRSNSGDRPLERTYRTATSSDLTRWHVIKTMRDTLPDDPWHALFATPPVLDA